MNGSSPVAWIASSAIRLRTIDPHDEDFGDLEPFATVVGDARVVQLGEQCHGDGASFHTKTRMIKFLHQRLGFDVLVWESGLYDCRYAWEALKRGDDPIEAVKLGIFGTWTRSKQVRPMFEYLGHHANTSRPLELAGMDSQQSGTAPRPPRTDDESDPWWQQCLRSFATDEQGRALREAGDVQAYSQLRDRQMGENLVALANDIYPGRRIAVWIDTGHMSKSFAPISFPEAPEFTGYVTAGQVAKEALGEAIVSIGFTASEGSVGASETTLGTIPLKRIDPPPPDSFEDLFVQAGLENAIVDLRTHDWLREPRKAGFIGQYVAREGVWPDVMDAVVFNRVMFPSEIAER